MSPQSRKICISITIHHHFLGCIQHQTIFFVTLEIPTYPLHIHIMWCLGVMCKPVTLVNSKGCILLCVWFQIQHHPYNRSIWIGTIYLSLITIRVFTNSCLNISGCWKPIKIIPPCRFQEFGDQYIFLKPKSNIIQCIDINSQELIQWFSLWVFPILTGTILLERIYYIINIRL